MATEYIPIPRKTYANETNMKRAIERVGVPDECKYVTIRTRNGRCFPLFIGMRCIEHGVHFFYNVVAYE